MSPREAARAFVRRFAAGDLEGLEALLAEGFDFAGPLLRAESKREYVDALGVDPPTRCPVRILEEDERGDEVTVRYELEQADRVVGVTQWFEVRDGLIQRSTLDFQVADPGHSPSNT